MRKAGVPYTVSGLDDRDIVARTATAPDSPLASVRREIPQKLATHIAISWSYGKYADPDLPILKQAKTEYPRLQSPSWHAHTPP
ncbi:MAG TPA: hypothetical protein VN948_12970 [Terriglobales bacterium]|nr:hypothetical protein [Terriglobales bacterium]